MESRPNRRALRICCIFLLAPVAVFAHPGWLFLAHVVVFPSPAFFTRIPGELHWIPNTLHLAFLAGGIFLVRYGVWKWITRNNAATFPKTDPPASFILAHWPGILSLPWVFSLYLSDYTSDIFMFDMLFFFIFSPIHVVSVAIFYMTTIKPIDANPAQFRFS